VFVFFLILLASVAIIDVEYSGLSDMNSKFVETVNPALNLVTPILAYIPFIVSLSFGLAIGIRKGD